MCVRVFAILKHVGLTGEDCFGRTQRAALVSAGLCGQLVVVVQPFRVHFPRGCSVFGAGSLRVREGTL